MSNNLRHSEVVKKAGEATKAKYGRAHYSMMGKKGQIALKIKYGPDYYKKIRAIGVQKQKERMKPIIDKLADIINGE